MIIRLLKKVIRGLDFQQRKLKSCYLSIGKSIDTGISLRLDVPRQKEKIVSIGDHSIVGGEFIFESNKGEVSIGNNTFIGGCSIISRSKVIIGNHVQIAWGTYLYDHNAHSTDFRLRREDIEKEFQSLSLGDSDTENKNWDIVKTCPIVIEDDVWIGMNSIILKGVTVGRASIVGAGSVIRKSVPPFCVVCGNPAKVVKFLYTPEEIEGIQKEYFDDHNKFISKEEYKKIIEKYLNTNV